MTSPLPADETSRLEALRSYNILDTLSEQDYEDITLLAATICKTPVSLITFIDEDRQWFKSHHGVSVSETTKEYAFCAHALNSPGEPLIVEDSRKDARFANNPLVTNDPYVIFYTGMPLVNAEGFALGTLCVIDHHPRKLSAEQISALETLSKQVVTLLEMRRSTIALQKTRDELEIRNKELEQFASIVSHDIKSPLSGISMANQILNEQFSEVLGKEGADIVNVSKRSADKIQALVDGILSYYKGGEHAGDIEEFNITAFFESIFSLLPANKKYELEYPRDGSSITMNKIQLDQIFSNLINNSIHYNDKEVIKIKISFSEAPQQYFFSITDNGIGIAKENQEKIFNLFTTIPLQATDSKPGYGIGLSTVKKIVERNGGIVTIESTPGKGTKISFNIKKGWPLGKGS
ncbi:MAG: GAF domain-containing sensor histidine kinase [Bacteroidota bacterium]|nr:GAF domain-containing sensor histidine kinase [Bacteroidota bacterium]